VVLERTDVSEERIASIIRVKKSVEFVPSSLILFTLMMEAIRSSEMSVPTRATHHHNPGDGILRSSSRFKNMNMQTVRSDAGYSG
jgi:hypothetical protein